jgi:integrase
MWRVHGNDVVRWQNVMRGAQLSETTINLRLAGLSSLFKFLKRQEYTNRMTVEMTYFMVSNPVEVPVRTKVEPFKSESATYITFDEFTALMRRIDRSRIEGLRDYALIMALFLTGQRSKAIGGLRWGDIEHPTSEQAVVYYAWASKAKTGRDELLRPAYDAITAYLKAAGRLDKMDKDDFIFQPLSDIGQRLAQRKAEKNNRTIKTRGENHLSGARINRIVKHAAARAGLDEARIHTHITRHSAAIWMSENGVGIEDIQRTLHHSSPATTMIYLRAMKKDRHPMYKSIGQFFDLS